MLLEAYWGEGKWGYGEARLVLADPYAERLSGLKDKLVFSFKLAAYMVRDGIRKFVCDVGVPAFLEMDLARIGW